MKCSYNASNAHCVWSNGNKVTSLLPIRRHSSPHYNWIWNIPTTGERTLCITSLQQNKIIFLSFLLLFSNFLPLTKKIHKKYPALLKVQHIMWNSDSISVVIFSLAPGSYLYLLLELSKWDQSGSVTKWIHSYLKFYHTELWNQLKPKGGKKWKRGNNLNKAASTKHLLIYRVRCCQISLETVKICCLNNSVFWGHSVLHRVNQDWLIPPPLPFSLSTRDLLYCIPEKRGIFSIFFSHLINRWGELWLVFIPWAWDGSVFEEVGQWDKTNISPQLF